MDRVILFSSVPKGSADMYAWKGYNINFPFKVATALPFPPALPIPFCFLHIYQLINLSRFFL